MQDRDTVIRHPHSKADRRTSVTMKTRGCDLVLFFDDLSGDGPVRELRLLPDTATLDPGVFRQFMPQAPLYFQYARAAIKFDRGQVRESLVALRDVGATRRGLGEDFYRQVARQYETLIAEDEKHPVKALAAMNYVTISTASRWISGARARGLIEERKEKP
jgi:hypothetical protein